MIIVDSCMIWFHFDCIMQLKKSYHIVTNVCSRKSATTVGDLPDWWNLNVIERRAQSSFSVIIDHDDVIKWKHFPRYWPFVRGNHRSPVNSPHRGRWQGAFMFSFICAWINGWVNNREAGDLRRHRTHYDVIVMSYAYLDCWIACFLTSLMLRMLPQLHHNQCLPVDRHALFNWISIDSRLEIDLGARTSSKPILNV